MDININSSQIVGDINMGIIDPIKSIVMVECNHEREECGSSKDLRVLRKLMRRN